ncbi:MAG: DMT family transporter [Rhodospirillales bacterium]|nr:DMT family transporter [Rhodospirillales bacterium]
MKMGQGVPSVVRGMGWMVVATLGFTVLHGGVRMAARELHPFEVAFFRFLFAFLCMLPILARAAPEMRRPRRLGLYLLAAALNAADTFLIFFALTITPLAKVHALAFTAPIFAAVLAVAVLGEAFRLRRAAALAVGFAGMLMVIRPQYAPFDWGAILVLISAAFWGATLIVMKALARTEASITVTFYMSLLTTLFALVPAATVWTMPSAEGWAWLVFNGALAGLAIFAIAQAFRHADVTAVTPLEFLKLVWAAAIGFFVFFEVPDAWTLAGGAVIFAGALILVYGERAEPAEGGAR